jgi:predicted NBD/HSP70 family sugar kinase
MYIGIDLLSFRMTAAIFSDLQRPEELQKEIVFIKRARERTFEDDHRSIFKLVQLLEAEHGRARAVGLSLPAEVPAGASTLVEPGEIIHWKGRPLAKIGKSIRCRVEIGGYVEANALAELHYGRSSLSDFQYVNWGRKVAVVQVQDGRVMAYEAGHFPVGESGPYLCSAGHDDCLEALVGSTSLLARYDKEMIRSLPLEAWEFAIPYFARMLEGRGSPLQHWVFGGGMIAELPGFADKLMVQLGRSTGKVQVSTATEPQSAGPLGALALLRRKRC